MKSLWSYCAVPEELPRVMDVEIIASTTAVSIGRSWNHTAHEWQLKILSTRTRGPSSYYFYLLHLLCRYCHVVTVFSWLDQENWELIWFVWVCLTSKPRFFYLSTSHWNFKEIVFGFQPRFLLSYNPAASEAAVSTEQPAGNRQF